MPCSDSVPAIRITGMSAIPTGISKETICAAARIPPMSEYLLLEANPPRSTPIETREETAIT